VNRVANRNPEAGWTLIELVVALALAGLLAALAAPPLLRAVSANRMRLAASEVATSMQLARAYAVRHSARVGLRFDTRGAGKVTWTLYRDGDGDGVLAGDIAAGTDPMVREAQLQRLGAAARFGFPPGPAPRDPGDPRRRLDRLEDPIRFNRSDMASFDPLGTATPGTVYLTDGRELLVAVRVTSRTGRVRVLRYDRASETWEGI
jgi:prepilin-type N-terminal cleavage/methylation domain-containing protein